jgi:hypothetical protein
VSEHAGGLRHHVHRHQRADAGIILVDSIHIRMSRVRLVRKKPSNRRAARDQQAEIGRDRRW